MQPETPTSDDGRVTEFIERMNGAGDGPDARDAYRAGFERLRSRLDMYPVSSERASVVVESAARTATTLADYQRCWLHLFLADMYLARVERLHQVWGLRRSAEQIMSLNELSRLREYALRLLDDFSSGSDLQPLTKTTSAMKLRVSLMAQSTMTALSGRADVSELGYLKSQPTADEIILRSIGALQS